ncbi:hypothetical protein ABIC09_001956 [Bradyrhizobium sp. S3.12.5]
MAGRKSPKDLGERAFAPQYASYFWFLAFGGRLIRRRMDAATDGKT